MDLDGGVIHNKGRLKGWAFKSRVHSFNRSDKWISPHPNPSVQPHINNRYIGNFMDKRQERDKRFQSPKDKRQERDKRFQSPFRDGL
jgi:hypothetical protein